MPVSCPRGPDDASGQSAARAPGERASCAAPSESLTFILVNPVRRELTVTPAAQPVFDPGLSVRTRSRSETG